MNQSGEESISQGKPPSFGEYLDAILVEWGGLSDTVSEARTFF